MQAPGIDRDATGDGAEKDGTVAVPCSWSSADRREAKRLNCSGGIEFHEVGSPLRNTAMVSDICVGGCYIETRTTLAAETRLELTLRFSHVEIAGIAEVRICHPGMGVAFREMTPENRQRLQDLVEKLSAGATTRRTPMPPAKEGSTLELLLFLVDTLKEERLAQDKLLRSTNLLPLTAHRSDPISLFSEGHTVGFRCHPGGYNL